MTNLYSSAIFIGWAAVLFGIFLERIFKGGIGVVCAGLIGFVTLNIAHHLALSGDTMEMLRAVLDTNLWLSTHVVVVTLGYASMFVAGLLAVIYIVRGYFTRSLTPELGKNLARMVYGIVCFATLFSFVGTILGGIWADQSWGRFWGWDPKENGALLIVLWNAVILHARWGGMIRERGLMVMAVFGNIVTSFSWFGVNMLGIGLHSYGFTSEAFFWLKLFDATQVALICLALSPARYWASFKKPEPPCPANIGGDFPCPGLNLSPTAMNRLALPFVFCALLLTPSPLRADDEARLPYKLIYEIQQKQSGLAITFTNLQVFVRMKSSSPSVKNSDLHVYIDSKEGKLPVKLDTNGIFSVPMRDTLLAENPPIVVDQPKGTMELGWYVGLIEPETPTNGIHYSVMMRPLAGLGSHPRANGARHRFLLHSLHEILLRPRSRRRHRHPRQTRRPHLQNR